jgi:ABC-type uncharacterized transport system ATPase subunit
MFEASRLHKRFGAQVVLEDVSLRFAAGRLSGIMGPNGAGKTTCFNLLTGRHAPDRGRVTFEGRDITGLPPRAIARLGISRSFQIMNLFDEYSALDNVLVATPGVRRRGFAVLADLSRDRPRRQPGDVAALEGDAAAVGCVAPGEQVEAGGLARPVRAHDAGEAPGLEAQAHVLEHHVRAEAFMQPACFEHG